MHDIMFTNFLTPAHPGSGTALGHIDRCIQREALNSYPMLQWRSIKGPLRAMLKFDEKKTGVSSDLAANFVFGKETEGASQLLIGDGNLLFYPAPVLKGLYLFFTSPAVLKRYSALSGDQIDEVDEIDTYLKNHEDCLCTKKTKGAYAVNNRFFTGGNFVLEPEIWNRQAGIEETLPGFSILKNFNKNLEEEIKERLVIVHDEMLKMLTLKTTEVRPNIKIENGLTVDGSLRYTEYLPEKTVLFSRIDTDVIDLKNNFQWKTCEQILNGFKETVADFQKEKLLRFGGEEGGVMGKANLFFRDKLPESKSSDTTRQGMAET